MGTEKSIVLFESADGSVELPVMLDPAREDVWLSRAQLATLFGRDVKTIGKHVANALREELAGSENRTVAKIATVQTEGTREVVRQVEHYNLDMVLSVGYRVKSARGVEFRRWATDVLRRYVIAGHAANERRLEQLGQVAKIMARVPESLESRQILDIVQSYTGALDLLDDYDHLNVTAPEGTPATHMITYEECREVIESLRFGRESSLELRRTRPLSHARGEGGPPALLRGEGPQLPRRQQAHRRRCLPVLPRPQPRALHARGREGHRR